MSSSAKKKVTLYFNSATLAETQREAIRLDRSVSWVIQAAWKIAREEIHRLPSIVATGPTSMATPTASAPAVVVTKPGAPGERAAPDLAEQVSVPPRGPASPPRR